MMLASPGDHSWLFVLANMFAVIIVSVPSMLLGALMPWGAAGESWLRAVLFAVAASVQWFVLGSIVDAVYQRIVRRP